MPEIKDKSAKKVKLISKENKVKKELSDEHKVPVQKDKYEKLLNKKRKISETTESNVEQAPGICILFTQYHR
jgi:hypothetical protein